MNASFSVTFNYGPTGATGSMTYGGPTGSVTIPFTPTVGGAPGFTIGGSGTPGITFGGAPTGIPTFPPMMAGLPVTVPTTSPDLSPILQQLLTNQNNGNLAQLGLLGQIATNTNNTNTQLTTLQNQLRTQQTQIENLTRLLSERIPAPRTPDQIRADNRAEGNRLAEDLGNQASFLTKDGDSPTTEQTKGLTGKALDAILKKGGLSNADKSKLEALKSQLEVATSDAQINDILGQVIGFVLDKVDINSLDIPAIEKTNLRYMKRKMSEKPNELLGGTAGSTQGDAFRALAAALKAM